MSFGFQDREDDALRSSKVAKALSLEMREEVESRLRGLSP